MGYETKLIVAIQYKRDEGKPVLPTPISYETVAELNLSGMPNEFFVEKIFDKPVEMPLFIRGEETTTDCYGKTICYCDDVKKVLSALYRCEGQEHYRRTELAINTLKSFTSPDWENIVVFNYGY